MEIQTMQQYLKENCKKNLPPGPMRMNLMADILGHPEKKFPAVHIAGTNGKGSCTTMLASILMNAGYTVGVFTSPHLHSYTERIRINEQLIPEEQYKMILRNLIDHVLPNVVAKGLDHPGEFEILTMIAFCYFAQEQPDIVLIEVGLGGKNDATNILSGILSIIMPIGLDHCEVLGDTAEKIAYEKAGIIKNDAHVIAAVQTEKGVATVLREVAQEKNSSFKQVASTDYRLKNHSAYGQSFDVVTDHHVYENLLIRLLGKHQVENATVVINAVECLSALGWSVTEEHIRQGLKQARWAGRMEYWEMTNEHQGILMDGAHNPPGVLALTNALKDDFSHRPVILLLGILDDKDQKAMLEVLIPCADKIIITKPAEKRADHWRLLVDMVQAVNPQMEVQTFDTITHAIDYGLEILPDNGLLCITGSLYLLGDCRAYLMHLDRSGILELKGDINDVI